MIFLLLLPVLAAGYFTSTYHPYVSLSSAREEGQRLYLRAVSLGFASLALGGLIALLLSAFLPDKVSLVVRDLPNGTPTYHNLSLDLVGALSSALGESGMFNQSNDEQSAWLVLLSATSFLGAGLLVLSSYIKYGRRAQVFWKFPEPGGNGQTRPEGTLKRLRAWLRWSKEAIKLDITAELLEQSPMDRMLFLTQATEGTVQFWMENRKVYVGMVAACAEPFSTLGTNNEVKIVPIMSGYQDEKDLRVHMTTYYYELSEEVDLILRQDQIRAVSEFNWDTFRALRSKPVVTTESH